ncbi:MAG TPA: HD domain-containing phosphohydrolase [Bryobacterales bacterium]|nr:HD domain-containing phosphohydrolase [Bryobacterales bacterium]
MSRTILVAGEDLGVCSHLKRLLTARNYEVVTAGGGLAALAEFHRSRPDLLLLETAVRGRDGFDVCRQLKNNPQTRLTPVILIGGAPATKARLQGIDAGADGVLTKPLNIQELLAWVRSLLRLKAYTDELDSAEAILFALARTIEGRDPRLEGHCERLAEYSSRLGKILGLAPEQITALRRAGIVHDIGKVAVPDSILLKPARLTAEEWKIMREHPLVGEKICAPLNSFRLVLPIIRHHHEKMDGSGYPDGLRGNEIPITARTLQLVDLYDGLTTQRPYRRALRHSEALARIEREVEEGWWDARIFCKMKEMFHNGNGRARRRSGAPAEQKSRVFALSPARATAYDPLLEIEAGLRHRAAGVR